ncbi:MAG: hypothetical protein U1E65_26005 [Myxococcota bacterium]
MLRKTRILGLAAFASLAACSPSPPTGGITAHLRIRDDLAPGHAALREAGVPVEVVKLVIAVYDTKGSTLAQTVLTTTPQAGEVLLNPDGGTWSLKEVPVGTDRVVRARAILNLPGSPFDRAVGFTGEKRNISVVAGQIQNVGTIDLLPVPGVRIPRLDTTPPGSPGALSLTVEPQGEALRASWSSPGDDDLAGFVVAYALSPTASATIARGNRTLGVGETIGGGVLVAGWLPDPTATSFELTGLPNNMPIKVFVFAYDGNTQPGSGLNYSGPATATQTPVDTLAPGAFGGLSVQSMGPTAAVIAFVGPGEDGATGTPDHYEVRTSTDPARLMDGASFQNLPAIAAPPVVPGGMMGTFSRPFSALGQVGSEPFYLGMRAIDASGNIGPIAVGMYTVGATLTPSITALDPEIALASAGASLRLHGQLFGTRTGSVSLMTATTAVSLRVISWTDSDVVVDVPPTAESGMLLLVRARDLRVAPIYVAVIARLPDVIDPATLPFSIVAAPVGPGGVHAVLDARDTGSIEHAIRRIFDELFEDVPFANLVTNAAASAIAGTYSALIDRFVFLEALDTGLSAAQVSTSTLAPAPQRILVSTATGIDGLGLAILTGTIAPAGTPALVAFSGGGRVRTASIADLFGGPINRFNDLGEADASGVQVLRGTPPLGNDLWMAYRVGTGTTAVLLSRTSSVGQPSSAWSPAINGPGVDRFALVDIPGLGFVVVYETPDLGSGHEVRVLPLSSFGQAPGYAPFVAGGGDRRLEDIGLVRRSGRSYLGLVTTIRSGGQTQLNYAEVDPGIISANGMGTLRGVVLETLVSTPLGARMGCKPAAVDRCLLILNGPNGQGEAFVRR